jgi:hypothetical protein
MTSADSQPRSRCRRSKQRVSCVASAGKTHLFIMRQLADGLQCHVLPKVLLRATPNTSTRRRARET